MIQLNAIVGNKVKVERTMAGTDSKKVTLAIRERELSLTPVREKGKYATLHFNVNRELMGGRLKRL